MKQLTDAERLEIALGLLSEHEDIDTYYKLCSEHEQDCKRNGFHNVPVECEGRECNKCTMTKHGRLAIDCPYGD